MNLVEYLRLQWKVWRGTATESKWIRLIDDKPLGQETRASRRRVKQYDYLTEEEKDELTRRIFEDDNPDEYKRMLNEKYKHVNTKRGKKPL